MDAAEKSARLDDQRRRIARLPGRIPRYAPCGRLLRDKCMQRLAPDFGFRLWDGSRLPGRNWPDDGLAITIADPGVVAKLVRPPAPRHS